MASWWERHGVPRLIKCACSQGQIMKARSKVVPHAIGDVLELGCGGGINMEFYDPARVTGFTGLDRPQCLQLQPFENPERHDAQAFCILKARRLKCQRIEFVKGNPVHPLSVSHYPGN